MKQKLSVAVKKKEELKKKEEEKGLFFSDVKINFSAIFGESNTFLFVLKVNESKQIQIFCGV